MNTRAPEDPRETLRELLASRTVPRCWTFRGEPGFETVEVARLVAVAHGRIGAGVDAERRLDALVDAVGGKRIAVIDPWRALPDLYRRLRGRPLPPPGDVYEVPSDLFAESRRAGG